MRGSQDRQNERQSQSKESSEEYDRFVYKFQQQIVDAWKPVPHTKSNVILYAILSAISITIGLVLLQTAPQTQQIYMRYDTACTPSKSNNDNSFTSPCKITFTLNSELKPPIYVYYGFKGFYQNHRRYLKYVSRNQLYSGDPATNTAAADCGDYYTNLQTFGNNVPSMAGTPLPNNSPAFPCGTISRMYYQLRDEIQGFKLYDQTSKNIPISQKDIAWPTDIGMHVNAKDSEMAFRVTEQTWLVWFRPAAESDFYKLNGIIDVSLPAGTYTVGIKNQVAPVWGEKWFSLSKSNWQGNRDPFLGVAFLIMGGVFILLLIIFLVKFVQQKPEDNKIM